MFSSLTHQNFISPIYGENKGERNSCINAYGWTIISFFYFAFQGVGLACHSFSTFFFSFFLGCGYASCFYFLLSVIQILLFLFIYLLDLTKRGFFFHDFSFLINLDYCIFFCHYFVLGENTILVPIFWGYGQFGPYILVAVNLVQVIFNLQSI